MLIGYFHVNAYHIHMTSLYKNDELDPKIYSETAFAYKTCKIDSRISLATQKEANRLDGDWHKRIVAKTLKLSLS